MDSEPNKDSPPEPICPECGRSEGCCDCEERAEAIVEARDQRDFSKMPEGEP